MKKYRKSEDSRTQTDIARQISDIIGYVSRKSVSDQLKRQKQIVEKPKPQYENEDICSEETVDEEVEFFITRLESKFSQP